MSDSSPDNSLTERKVSSESVFSGNLLDVYKDQVELPDGAESTREYIKHQGAAAVLPVFENGDVMLIRQFRYPLHQVFIEVPAGKIDPGESPVKTARRELKEETGITCTHLQPLDYFYPSIGYTDEIIYLYVGWDIETYEQQIDQEEFLQKHRIPFADACQQVVNGEITDSKTALLLLKAALWWRQEGPFPVDIDLL